MSSLKPEDTNTLEHLFVPNITTPFNYISIIVKFSENFKDGEMRIFDIFNYDISWASEYNLACNMCIKYVNHNSLHMIKCFLTPVEYISLKFGHQQDKWTEYMTLLFNKINTLNTSSYPNFFKVEIDNDSKEINIFLNCSENNDKIKEVKSLPVLFAPDFSKYKNVADIVQGYDAAEQKRAFDIKCENIKIVNNIASQIDKILSSAYDDNSWKKTWIYGYWYKNLQSAGCNPEDHNRFYIDKTKKWIDEKPLIRCYSDNVQMQYEGGSISLCGIQTPQRDIDILTMLAGVFGPLASIVQVGQNIECHIRFPEAPDTSDEQA